MCGVVLGTYRGISQIFFSRVVQKEIEKICLFSQHPLHPFLLSRLIVGLPNCFDVAGFHRPFVDRPIERFHVNGVALFEGLPQLVAHILEGIAGKERSSFLIPLVDVGDGFGFSGSPLIPVFSIAKGGIDPGVHVECCNGLCGRVGQLKMLEELFKSRITPHGGFMQYKYAG